MSEEGIKTNITEVKGACWYLFVPQPPLSLALIYCKFMVSNSWSVLIQEKNLKDFLQVIINNRHDQC